MSAHTPGPWSWLVDADELSDTLPRLIGADDVSICDFGDSTTYYPTSGNEPNKADMALIAAAPDLLEALSALLPAVVSNSAMMDKNDWLAVDKANAAIAKARGEV